jgi:hypothetical protein
MGGYYFDLRDSEGLIVDEEGLELQDVEAAQEEAVLSLSDATRDGLRRSDGALNQMTIEVRTDTARSRASVSRSMSPDGISSRDLLVLPRSYARARRTAACSRSLSFSHRSLSARERFSSASTSA